MFNNNKTFYVIIKTFTFFVTILLLTPLVKAQSPTSENWSKPNILGWDTNWKFKPDIAESKYFSRDYNDDSWKDVTYKFLDTIAPNSKDFKNIGTFRRKFYVPDSMKGKTAELFFNHVGACKIYFDGNLIFTAGEIDSTIKNVIAFQQSLPLVLDSLPWHVLAIYYASSINKDLIEAYGLRGFGITLVASSNSHGDHNDPYHHIIISLGIIAGFGLFFWFVFAFYPTRVVSLLSALMLTNFSLIFLGAFIRDMNEPSLTQFITGEKLWQIGFSCTFGWFLLVIYSVYHKKLSWYNLIVAVMMSISILMILTQYSNWFIISVVFVILYVIETWRMIIKGLIKHKTGFWVLAAGLLLSNIGTLLVIFNVFHLFPGYLTPTQTILGVANDLIFPLTLALHLAWEFGSANRDLRKQLNQVKELSDKTVEQEKEKQQLLASQNETLEQQVSQRTSQLNQSIQELKSTQAQLIQSEKMASLGELTAGIAHEIQNPLNFVNNFSEVNKELIEELKIKNEELKFEDQEVNEILNDIKANEEKINYHGKRADAIVKGMLQHSRTSVGAKEPTDINALCDEYLRLSYHGLRAKEKEFNADFKTDFDTSVGNINIISQDIGRLLLNLYNNAFYAVKEKQVAGLRSDALVAVSTKKTGNRVSITVRDNGNGIPQSIVDKIFQPFFTTKPTGQGTGLGLSLSYDIVKAHGGEIKVESKEGEGGEFIIVLPANV